MLIRSLRGDSLLAQAAQKAIFFGLFSFFGPWVPDSKGGTDELPAFSKVSDGYTEVTSSDLQSTKGLFKIWKRTKDSQMLGELPKNFAGKRYFLALTVSSGNRFAGLQSGDWVVQWRKYNNRLALIVPNLAVRATGDPEAKASVKRLFTDQVILDVPIVAKGPSGGPVVDLDALLVGRAWKFFGRGVQSSDSRLVRLVTIKKAKVFPKNIELAFEIVGQSGRLQTIHYSISEVPRTSNGFKPRKADERIGYFTTAFSDFGKYDEDETRVRYINRWHLEKRDSRLKLSPPKRPIRFYVEHTAPVRYRRWIKQGVDYWNDAFKKVGLIDAIVVEYQDASSGAHMEKDPENVHYNFIRWLNNDISTAIGPSRVHPETGQILDADVILTDGWIRHFRFNYNQLLPKLATEGMGPETLAWLGDNPSWDPRIRLASPSQGNFLRDKFARQSQQVLADHEFSRADPALLGDDPYDGLYGRVSQKNGFCMAAGSRSLDLAIARMDWQLALTTNEMLAIEKKKKKKKRKKLANKKKKEKNESKDKTDSETDKDLASKPEPNSEDSDDDQSETVKEDEEEKPKENLLDGMPEWFIGPLLAELVAHEIGHTLGLRHNFKASGAFSLDEINSPATKGKKPFAASVMDYLPINYRYESGDLQGDYAMTHIGVYDYWAIEYGYTHSESDLPKILKRCVEPELQYATDEDTMGPDPLARRYDFGKDPLNYAKERTRLNKVYRERILEKFVKEGDSWAKARRGYELTLMIQLRTISTMGNWVGGVFVRRDKKGDPGDRSPIQVVPAAQQRAALQFVIDQAFRDEAYGLSKELLARMSDDKWLDTGVFHAMSSQPAWPIHDRILGIQATALTQVMNPTTMRRVYDNEIRTPADQDILTLPELLKSLTKSIWGELDKECPEDCDVRKPMISSFRRNLQREHLERLIDLVIKPSDYTAAFKPIGNLARMELRNLRSKIATSLKDNQDRIDGYTEAHLTELTGRIERALEAGYLYNAPSGGNGRISIMFGKESDSGPEAQRPIMPHQ